MADITIPVLDEALVARLTERAGRHGRTLEEEIREILASTVPVKFTSHERLEFADTIRSRSERSNIDSTDLIREDRDNR